MFVLKVIFASQKQTITFGSNGWKYLVKHSSPIKLQ